MQTSKESQKETPKEAKTQTPQILPSPETTTESDLDTQMKGETRESLYAKFPFDVKQAQQINDMNGVTIDKSNSE